MTPRALLLDTLSTVWERYEVWRRGKSLLTDWPPPGDIIAPLVQVIGDCDTIKKVEGKSLFSGYSGIVLTADRLAAETLRHAYFLDEDRLNRSIDWLLSIAATEQAPGYFCAAIWGVAVHEEIQIADSTHLIPFYALPNGNMKNRISDRAAEQWNKSVWQTQTRFDKPAAAIVRRMASVQFIGSPEIPFRQVMQVETDLRDQLALIEAVCTGKPVVAGSWFQWEDRSLDFNEFENYMVWHLPEVVPHIDAHVEVNAEQLADAAKRFHDLPDAVRQTLLRSTERFVLSQCRHRTADRVLDLALALEIAVGGGVGDNAPASWKVAVRSAQLIGGQLESRLEIRRTLSQLYSFRSAATHGGRLEDRDRDKMEKVVKGACDIYKRVVVASLLLGDAPNWNLIELNARV